MSEGPPETLNTEEQEGVEPNSLRRGRSRGVEIVAIVEGQTEQTFVRDQLAEHLGSFGFAIWAILSGKTQRQGGVKKWDSARNDIIRPLRAGRFCTTMFDYYAMPSDWPGRREASKLAWAKRAAYVEAMMAEDIGETIGVSFNPSQFIPYVQLHEFEALLFSDTGVLAAAATAISPITETYYRKQFDAIITAAGHPEAIDDGFETCPSRRIKGIVAGFRKGLHSPIVARRIGLDRLVSDCSHFGSWIKKLESLALTPK
ncbi:MAG TPA: DUF4276 family protein [Phycisphaerae bacterium]|nr:DUF4276 family protein [Phycisphaerae bacterium]